MILTFKIRHGLDLSTELAKAKQVAEFAVLTKSRTSKDVRYIGLKSALSNQILKKYSKQKNCRKVSSVKLTVPSQSVKFDQETRQISIVCLRASLDGQYLPMFVKINQIEMDGAFAYVSTTIDEKPTFATRKFIGVDLNSTSHCAVMADPENGKVFKLGKMANHVHRKYMGIRKKLFGEKARKARKRIKRRESRIVKNLNNRISRKIVDYAAAHGFGIKMENLGGIRKNRNGKTRKNGRHTLNSWSFHQLRTMVEYKAKLLGVPFAEVDPHWTSQRCSRCGLIGDRNKKKFACPRCGHVDHADANAAFNISKASVVVGKGRSSVDRDTLEGSTDTPHMVVEGGNAVAVQAA